MDCHHLRRGDLLRRHGLGPLLPRGADLRGGLHMGITDQQCLAEIRERRKKRGEVDWVTTMIQDDRVHDLLSDDSIEWLVHITEDEDWLLEEVDRLKGQQTEEWEEFQGPERDGSQFLCRKRIPGGWLVLSGWEEITRPGGVEHMPTYSGICFVPESNYKWVV